ncbi:hypothetical protein CEUSTIGMA_g12716.t1 [Chlamydomonas eustigma]|uniref:Aspergillus nuclease S1 n=1 Tax=Chlamydomonas eustigma TaxID=1157962 RepID=A0A250XQR8_9CHLO|nr:hypothetical protein CEUSTIGMA_g12716.t1 [Chlamydomonas eustigma]|eukprot:GAX85299.1 hypothetical protein CEUSTIGMA_g12716.t1 [Chlamydomonas eustigma]
MICYCTAFWDNGHMLVAEIAKQYLKDSGDLAPVLAVLQAPDGLSGVEAFHDLADSAVWMDQIKCTHSSPGCSLHTFPSFNQFNNWHYGGKCIAVNFYPETANPCPGVDRLDTGLILNAMFQAIDTFSSTKSLTSAAMALRIILHLMGDIHQPLHCSGGAVDHNHPQGDVGGNARRFNFTCPSANLHMLWDSGGLKYLNNWSLENYTEISKALQENSTSFITNSVGLPDALNFNTLEHMPYYQFVAVAKGDYGMFGRVLHEQAEIAKSVAYGTNSGIHLNPKYPGSSLDCPTQHYFELVQNVTDLNIGRAGYRLYQVLKQISRQIVHSGILPPAAIPPSVPPAIKRPPGPNGLEDTASALGARSASSNKGLLRAQSADVKPSREGQFSTA